MKTSTPSIKDFLDRTLDRYHRREFLGSDPLEFVHQEVSPHAQEIAAIVSALFAYGNVTQIKKSVARALHLVRELGDDLPSGIREIGEIADFGSERGGVVRGHFTSFYHRFNVADDLVILLWLIARSHREHGSVGGHFIRYLDPYAADATQALDGFLNEWRQWAEELPFASASFRYLVTRPQDGSCCKRWCMLLRWMGRKDHLDPGLWRANSTLITGPHGLKSSQLVMPLDTHTGRISQYIRLTDRKTLHWKAAQEITAKLREYDPEDPTKYDFALARLGILDVCQRKFRAEICQQCDLVKVCHFARKNLKKSSSTVA